VIDFSSKTFSLQQASGPSVLLLGYHGQMAREKTILTTDEIEEVRQRATRAIAPLKVPDQGRKYKWGDKRTNAGRQLPPYYLVYFLLVELLKFPNGGRWEKVAWTIPVDFNGNGALIEHRKMGLGVFSNLTPEDEAVAAEIVAAVRRGIGAARPFFDHLAAQAVRGSRLNVRNNSPWLLSRYTYLRDQYREKRKSVKNESLYNVVKTETTLPDGRKAESLSLTFSDAEEARWIGVAAIDAFFSWTEHVLIHVGILRGKITTAEDVAKLADAEWSEKVKAAIDLAAEKEMKEIYEELLEIRRQVRNYMAHGAFGKQGEAFTFHSMTGAVPVNLTDTQGQSRFSMTFVPSFDEPRAIEVMESFIAKLWEGERAPAKLYLDNSDLPVILTYARDGTYARVMSSEEDMEIFIEGLSREIDNAANMDW
jgi:hypothetical protein